MKLRYKIGRRLMRPLFVELFEHYDAAATENHRAGKHEEERNCAYIIIGLRYLGSKAPGHE